MKGGVNYPARHFNVLDDSVLLILDSFDHSPDGPNLNGKAIWNRENFTTLASAPATESWSGSVALCF
ncbi:MAG: hypothetical protein ACJA15_002060 [Flavobacteriales bacterium]|jgi:hypothetical protein